MSFAAATWVRIGFAACIAVLAPSCESSGTIENPTCTDPSDPNCPPPEPPPSIRAPICAESRGDRSHTPVDIIWAVDSSHSMQTELQWVAENMMEFFQQVTGYHLNVRIILLGGDVIEVPESVNADGDVFLHIKDYVGSHDSLEKIIEWYPRYKDFLRANAKRIIVVTTDDNSDLKADPFDAALKALNDPAFNAGYVFHSIVSFGDSARGCATGAAKGHTYLRLTERTEGLKYPICDANWQTIFSAFLQHLAEIVTIQCVREIPALPAGTRLAGTEVFYADNTAEYLGTLTNIANADHCADPEVGGWYYNNDLNPTQVILCPEVCASFNISQVKINFHCDSVVE